MTRQDAGRQVERKGSQCRKKPSEETTANESDQKVQKLSNFVCQRCLRVQLAEAMLYRLITTVARLPSMLMNERSAVQVVYISFVADQPALIRSLLF
jgi:hypothetical protein